MSARFRSCFRLRAAGMLLALVLALAWGVTPGTAWAGPKEYEVKAAFVLNFTRFVQWPEGLDWPEGAPLVIGVVDDAEILRSLEKIAVDQSVRGRAVEIRDIRKLEDTRDCRLVFVRNPEDQFAASVLAFLRGKSVLLVGDETGFAENYGGIAFTVDNRRVGFVVHVQETNGRGLQISSKLLRLAQSIVGEEAK